MVMALNQEVNIVFNVINKDIWETLTNKKPSPHEEIVHCIKSDIRNMPGSIRLGDYKLIGDELYNIKEDPYEKDNIANNYPDKINKNTINK